jgi:chemotaxis protein methyltransferase CheR
MNPVCLEKGRSGNYPASSLREVNRQDLSAYFNRGAGRNHYAVISALKKGITWKRHHLLQEPPGSKFEVIFMRNNILTYYQTPLKKKTLDSVIGALAPSGFLIIGSHERLPDETTALTAIPTLPYVFRKCPKP